MEFKGTKVIVGNQSKEVLEKLLELGYKWHYPHNIDAFYALFIDARGEIVLFETFQEFYTSHRREITANEILNFTPPRLPQLKPFQKVLVRNGNGNYWKIELFSNYTENKLYPFEGVVNIYKQCIPYKGNEHLIDTKKTRN